MVSQRQLFLGHCAQTSDSPLLLEFEKAEGLYLYDKNGNKYLDLISGISVSNLGHRHPKVIDAVKAQLDKYTYLMVYGEYVQSPQTHFASLLTEKLPQNLSSVYFVNSGSEATEGAIKLAKRYTGRAEIVSFKKAYHGSTNGALSVIGDEALKRPFRPLLPGITTIDFNDPEQLQCITNNTAAVIIETIQGEAGVRVPDKEFLKALRRQCDATGALLILDEAQTGFGRTGKLFAFQHFDIVPDILLLAKGLGGGFPLGAFIASRDIMSVLSHNPVLGHITTFGGHPVSCVAGLATLQEILQSGLTEGVAEKEKLFIENLKHKKIKEARSFGLMIALEFDSYEFNKKVIDNCIGKKIITDWFLFADNCLRIAPPLIIDNETIIRACDEILTAIELAKKSEK